MNKQWIEAQSHEKHHGQNADVSRRNYEVFQYLAITAEDVADRTILEIGGGNFPVCGNLPMFRRAVNVDPLWVAYHDKLQRDDVEIIPLPFEQYEAPSIFDEAWIFNVLQHVVDPRMILRKAKSCAKVLRVFEPINWPTDKLHLHVLTEAMFHEEFPQAEIKIYKGGTTRHFHESDCIYFSTSQEPKS